MTTDARPVSVVTGAASGMGYACAERLVRRGGVLVAVDLSPSLADAVKALQAHAPDGVEVRPLRCDFHRGDVLRVLRRPPAAGAP